MKRQARQRAPKTGANMEPKPKKPLKPKHEAFAVELVANGGNASEAARRVGVTGPSDTIRKAGHRMSTNVHIQARIQEMTRERLKGVKATSDEVLVLLADHLRSDIGTLTECMNADGTLDIVKAKEMGASHLIKKLKMRTLYTKAGEMVKTTEIELHDSQSAAAKLGEYLGLKQMPRVNQEDVARVNAEIARMVANGWEPDVARQIAIEAEPQAAQWLN